MTQKIKTVNVPLATLKQTPDFLSKTALQPELSEGYQIQSLDQLLIKNYSIYSKVNTDAGYDVLVTAVLIKQ